MKTMIVEFDGELDDAVFNQRGDLVVPGGRPAAVRIARCLNSKGFKTSSVLQRSFYGWEFVASTKRGSFLAVVQQADTWLVSVSDTTIFGWRWLFGSGGIEIETIADEIGDCILSCGLGTNVRYDTP